MRRTCLQSIHYIRGLASVGTVRCLLFPRFLSSAHIQPADSAKINELLDNGDYKNLRNHLSTTEKLFSLSSLTKWNAYTLLQEGQLEDAKIVCEQNLEMGNFNVDTLSLYVTLAGVHMEYRHFRKALDLCNVALEKCQFLEDSSNLLEVQLAKIQRARALIGLEEFWDAEKALRASFNELVQLVGSDHVETLRCMDALATCLMLRSDYPDNEEGKRLAERYHKEAEQLFRAIYNTHCRIRGPAHRLSLRAAANLGR